MMATNPTPDSNVRINLRSGLVRFLVILLLLSPVFFLPGRAADNNKDFILSIIHTNDLHAHEEPFQENGKTVGGMAKVGHIIRLNKKKYPDALVLDGGDIFQGSLIYSKFKGEVEVKLLNDMGYDVYTIGNHEFDDGPHNLAEQLSKAKFDVVNANMDASAVPKLQSLIKTSVIKTVNGERIGIIGGITPDLEALANHLEGVKLKVKGANWIEPIKEEVDKLKSQGVNKIILLTHCGIKFEKELAEKLPDVDAIVGGHSHTRLDKPEVIKHADGTTTSVVQASCYGKAVGVLNLTFDSNGVVKPAATKYQLIDINDKVEDDPDLKAYIDKVSAPFAAATREIVGEATDYFEKKPLLCDCSMGNIICDAIVESGQLYGVTMSFHNRGGIRGVLQKGPVNVAQISQILPFDNYVVFATVPGSVVRKNLEHSIGDGLGGHFLDVHGLKFAYDKTRPSGDRILFITADDGKGNYKPLDDNANYKMAMNHYNFEGGESYDFKAATNVKKTDMRMSDSITNYIRKHKVVTPSKPNRIVCVKEGVLSLKDLHLAAKGLPANSRITLAAGTAFGVSKIYNSFPVPLENAQILKTGLKGNQDGSWNLDISKLRSTYKYAADDKDRKMSMCIIAYPPKGSSDHTVISAPVEVPAP